MEELVALVVEKTGFSWSFVKKTLSNIKENYDGFYFEKSGSTWIIWKNRDNIIKKLDETCARFFVAQHFLNQPRSHRFHFICQDIEYLLRLFQHLRDILVLTCDQFCHNHAGTDSANLDGRIGRFFS